MSNRTPTEEQRAIIQAAKGQESLMVTEIKLTQGYSTLVDVDDYDAVMAISTQWRVLPNKYTFYAIRTERDPITRKRWTLMLHRLIAKPSVYQLVHHIDGNGLNNSKSNLMVTSNRDNQKMRHNLNQNNSSGTNGIYWNKLQRQWHVKLGRIHIGFFNQLEDAIAARKKAEKDYWDV